MKPAYDIYLPSWKPLKELANSNPKQKRGCRSCRSHKAYWREFLTWYEDNPKAIDELKKLTQKTKIEFFNNLVKPIRKVVL